jgi:hypothetical protein
MRAAFELLLTCKKTKHRGDSNLTTNPDLFPKVKRNFMNILAMDNNLSRAKTYIG